jgi:hypothetical protein
LWCSHTWFLETKRKRHDPNPVSKSVGSSELLDVIERKRGKTENSIYNKDNFEKCPDALSKTRDSRMIETSATYLEDELESEDEDEPLPKTKRKCYGRHNSMHLISFIYLFICSFIVITLL